jgi:periplasmic mercuric ion binding protein
MKNLIIGMILMLSAQLLTAQDKKITQIEIKVNGNCGDCKERIETAADIKGVKSAVWNPDNKILKLVFRNDKTDLNTIKAAVAKAGYSSDGIKADAKAYAKLPACCQYDDRTHEEATKH